MPTLRFLSIDATSMPLERREVARLIGDAAPDVAALHGAPGALRWRSKCGAVAREAGMVVVEGGRVAAGTLLLSSLGVDVDASRSMFLEGSSWRGPAGAAVAAFRHGGSPFAAVVGRVTGNAVQRQQQTTELRDRLADVAVGDPPAILSVIGADRPGTAAWHVLAAKRTFVPGGVFVDDRITVTDRRELDAGAGGFAPLVLELTLPG